MTTQYSSPEYRLSRRAYALECTFEYFVALLVADSFLAKLLTSLGFSDAQTGLVSSLISFAFLFQLFAIPMVQHITNVKRFSILFHSLSQLFFMSLYLVPFYPVDPALKRALMVVCILLAYLGNYIVTTVIFRWGNSFADPNHRALFSANKEMISLLSGIGVSLLFGYFIDHFELAGNMEKGFIFAAVGILIFSVCDFICLMLIKNERPKTMEEKLTPVLQVLRILLREKKFLYITLLVVLRDVARYMTFSFLGTYKLNDLLFTVGQVQLINIIGILARFALSRPFGRYSDRHSYAKGVELALCIAAIAYTCIVFTNPTTRWLLIAFVLLNSVCQAGLVANLTNMMYTYVDKKYFVQANAIKNSIGGLCGFGASVLGSRILSTVQLNGNHMFGLPIYGQQLLAFISVVVLVCAFLLTRFVIGKQHIMKH